MSFNIEQGLFNLDFTDYHAILGVAVNAELKDVRKRYLTIARRLHPDSCATESQADRQRAAEFLSKLVNPAYEKLGQEKEYNEYCIVLKLKGQQAQRQQETVMLTSDPARKLAAASEVENTYRTILKQLTDRQYDQLQDTLGIIGQISELNLVYLMRTNGKDAPKPAAKPASSSTGSSSTGKASSAPPQPARKAPAQASADDLVAAYLRRSEEYERKGDTSKAILELREAIPLSPKNSTIHSRLGMIYLRTKQGTMAKIHFNKALELNPNDEVAIAGKRALEQNAPGAAAKAQPAKGKGNKTTSKGKGGKSDKSGGGLFGLFGGKKK
jgi:curved DNA-binding protein CbpA